MEETEQTTKKPANIIEIEIEDTQFIILGTAHISKQSVEDVREAAEKYKVDCIAVELDNLRYQKITKQESAFDNLDVFSVIKQKKALLLFSSILLSSFQRRLGDQLGIAPGAEMLAGIEESKARGIPCALIDRPVDITLRRAWKKSSFWKKQKIFAALIAMMFAKGEKVSEEDLQELKEASMQGEMLEELTSFLPELKQVLLDERDEYLSSKMLQNKTQYNCKRMLVVLGAAHVSGVCSHLRAYKKHLETQKKDVLAPSSPPSDSGPSNFGKKNYNANRVAELEHIPKTRSIATFLKFLIPIGIIALFVQGFITGGTDTGIKNIVAWFLINGGISLLGAIVSLATPLTMVVAFVGAPFTSINPFLGVGFLTGLTEAWVRKPRVKDILDLQELQLSVKAIYKNRVTRILLVFLCTSLGSSLGTFLAFSAFFWN